MSHNVLSTICTSRNLLKVEGDCATIELFKKLGTRSFHGRVVKTTAIEARLVIKNKINEHMKNITKNVEKTQDILPLEKLKKLENMLREVLTRYDS